MSTDTVYLALYKGRRDGAWYKPSVATARVSDWIIRTLTGSPYSHCELALPHGNGQYDCCSSSIRDGGVRVKGMPLPSEKWDLIPVDVSPEQVYAALVATIGAKYDWLGATGVIARWRHDKRKYFCSEWCAMALGLANPERFCPGSLAAYLQTTENAAR
ncbi:hypothetical protein [Kingella denitrificans]|uniref:hypothetical protein n=1 Tax=Kingella denitrificans TaxID=502 RepID=UPI00288A14E0|nr:hypothetical protein [Kingella denitrificans]